MFTGGGPSRNRCLVVYALLLKAIGASEGWRNAIRCHTRSLSTSRTHPAVGGLFFALKGALANPSDLSIAENCKLATCRGRRKGHLA